MEQEARATVAVLSVITLSEEERGKLGRFSHFLPTERFVANASTYWDKFYDKHEARFFKNRKWLPREFVELIDGSLCSGPFLSGPPSFPGKNSRFRVLEVGSGPGNSVVPILENRW